MSNTLLQSQRPDIIYQKHRPTKKQDYTPIPIKWYYVLALYLKGKSPQEISELTGYASGYVYHIINNPSTQSVRQQLLDQTNQDLESLFGKVVENIRQQLDSKDPQIQLAAQTQFFKATGKYTPKQANKGSELTAEDVVSKLLQVNVQVNVQSDTK